VADQLRPKAAKLAMLMDQAEADVLAFMSFPKVLRARFFEKSDRTPQGYHMLDLAGGTSSPNRGSNDRPGRPARLGGDDLPDRSLRGVWRGTRQLKAALDTARRS
jgi:hypothetical protein